MGVVYLLQSIWKGSNYENKLKDLSPVEFEENKRALFIEENDEVE